MTRRRKLLYAAIALMGSLVLAAGGLLAADLYLHSRAERSAGLNRWGYRGPVVGKKHPNEVRVAVLGGSTVFGYGGRWDEALPPQLEQALNRTAGTVWRAINLGYNTEGAFAFRINLDDFAYLDYDIVCLYEGYNDLLGDIAPNYVAIRHQSPLFRLTGYLPIFPLVFREKAMMLQTGDLAVAYQGGPNGAPQTVFRPTLTDRTSAAALNVAADVGSSLERQLGHLSDQTPTTKSAQAHGCPTPWTYYCDAQYQAITYATERGKRVLVVSQPRLIDPRVRARHDEQQSVLAAMMRREFSGRADVAYVDLRNAIDLNDTKLSFDQMHLTAEGNRVIAAALAEPIRSLQPSR